MNFLLSLVDWSLKRPKQVVFLSFFLLCGGLFLARSLEINTQIAAFFPRAHPAIQELDRIMEKSGGYGNFMVIIESPDPKSSVQYAEALRKKLEPLPWISHTEYEVDTSGLARKKILYMPQEDLETIEKRIRTYRQELIRFKTASFLGNIKKPKFDLSDIKAKYSNATTPSQKKRFQSTDGETLIMIVWPTGKTGDIDFIRRCYHDLKNVLSQFNATDFHPQLVASLGGILKNKLDELDAVIEDVRLSGLIAIIGIILLCLIFFRSLISLLLLFFPLATGISLTFAGVALAIGELNLLTVFLFIVLVGLGIDFGAYFLAYYRQERRRSQDVKSALQKTVVDTARPSWISAVTTGVAFLGLILTGFRGFNQFGVITGFGIFVVFLGTYTLLPPLVFLLEQKRLFRPKPFPLLTRFAIFSPKIAPVLCGFFILLSILALIKIPALRFEYDFNKIRSQSSSYWEQQKKIEKVFELTDNPAIIFAEDLAVARQIQQTLQKKIGPDSTIEAVHSLGDYLPENQEAKLALIESIREMSGPVRDELGSFAEDLDVTAVTTQDLPFGIRRYFSGLPGTDGSFVYIYNKIPISNLKQVTAYIKEIGEIHVGDRIYRPAAEVLLYSEMLDLLREKVKWILWVIVLIIGLSLWINQKNLVATFLVGSPLILGMILFMGTISLLGLKLNIFNMIVPILLLGMGIDHAIHLHYHLKREGGVAFNETWGLVASACLFNVLTTMVGFGSLIVADHPGLRLVGIFVIIGLTVILLTTLFFLPALIKLVGAKLSSR